MSIRDTPVLPIEAIGEEFRSGTKSYERPGPIDGVAIQRLPRFVDDRGFFQEIYRAKADHAGSESLAAFFRDVPVAQLNYTIVNAENHVKGLHYHLKQQDVWFCPHPSKAKFVLFDVRKASPTYLRTQVVVAGDGQDLLVRIPEGVAHGYRPLTNPCALFYLVTRTFDVNDPDEHRIPWDHPAVRDLWEVPNG
ncbi:MAG TPA: dTDP-4-dehydrorhamnose 3,5-epimerase family protein [Thermoanaerobaculia bacterium]|jgi:dTDP-4-dehydrorhamnose 3,5-epimerase|nr:dTDP-4-dehydrorhamnose 3,5-epimerase family protein [Thermoanaerobaculia bacterium]HPA50158.1 dTDP-4-dehydrorhamnose 3,5-epimerase family protein [Thermoanaerobaculia bacterium]HQN07718.1 dTDP-4-dehydrorhamnose 3,5-epimerase family protein [Thermoanaerobaculia bacterium]HQP85101.1 dTDP-4-dehydrorhamnose 3,5-epimerase family protein [Thermoanaerobaculia bacterium]